MARCGGGRRGRFRGPPPAAPHHRDGTPRIPPRRRALVSEMARLAGRRTVKSSFSSARPLATPLRDLVQQFLEGDRAAADQLFHIVQPYLLRVVRRRLSAPLRVKLDSADIVQSVWADVWRKRQQGGWHFD